MKKIYLLTSSLLAFAIAAYSQPVILDPSFGVGGKVYTNLLDINKAKEAANAVAIQADGKIIMAGSTKVPAAILRYNTNGSLDNSFDNDGKVFCFGLSINAIAIQNDGKILVIGTSNNDFALARFNSNGSPDNSFGTVGRLTTAFGSGVDIATCIILQSDQKILVAGYSHNGTDYDFAIARYNSNGSADNSFDGDGKLALPIGSSNDQVAAMAIQSDGKIVLAGQSFNGSNYDFAAARLNTDGSPDNSFSGDGKLITSVSGDATIKALFIKYDGKIIVGGLTGTNINYQGIVLCQFNSDGNLDNSFDSDGILTVSNSFLRQIHSMIIQDNGKILLAGTNNNNVTGNFNFALARLDPDGNLDNSFDGDGTVITAIGPAYNRAVAIAIQSDGKIVAAGKAEATGGTAEDFAIARYNVDGIPDNGFGNAGALITTLSSSFDTPKSIAIQIDGKIIIGGSGGSVDLGSVTDVGLVRYNPDGSLDNSFGGDGKVTLPVNSPNSIGGSVLVQPDGKILVTGSVAGSNSDFLVARYNTDGSLDNSFDGDGKSITDFGGHEYPSAIAIQNDGKIIVAGQSGGSNTADFAIARYNIDGSPDNSFDDDGKVKFSLSSWGDFITSLIIQPDGKILVAGRIGTGYDVDFALVRLNGNGSFDNSFDGDGILIFDVSSSIDNLSCMAIQTDGKILIGGTSRIGEDDWYAVIARFNADGSPDNGFDSDGKWIGTVGNITSIIIQSNGKILAGLSNFTLMRFNANGTPDNSFDGDGTAVFDQSNSNSQNLISMKVYANRIYIVGSTQTEGNSDFGLAAVLSDALLASLPLQLLEFSGKLPNDDALLMWKTENEFNASSFIIERSADGRNFIPVGAVNAKSDPSVHNYNFTDYHVTSLGVPVFYYRLKQTDKDGGFAYSRTIALPVNRNGNLVMFYPNPVINELNIALTVNRQDKLQVRIVDNKGSVMKQEQWNVTSGSTSLSINVKNLAAGMYYLVIKGESIDYKKQFVK